MMYRYFSMILILCFSTSVTGSYADEKPLSGDTTSTAPGTLHTKNNNQMPGKAFELLIKEFQAGDSGAKAALCELRAQSYDNGNIILVKKIEEHRYRNNYTCDELVKVQSKAGIKTEPAGAAANTAQDVAKREEQERQAIAISTQKLAAAIREKQERAATDTTRLAAEKLERERLAAIKAAEEKALAAKAAAAKEQQQKEKMEQERLAAEATRKALEKLEQERLLAAIAEEKRTLANKAEQERIAAIKAAQEHQKKERIKQAQRAAEEARLAAVKQERERIASAAAQAKKDAAAKAVTEQAAAAKASKERLTKERAEQIQAAAKTAPLAAEKQEHKRIAAAAKDTPKMTASKAGPKPSAPPHAAENRKPDSTPNPPKPGQPMPGLNLTSFSGMPVSPDYYRGSVLLIDFFAPWCQICRRHIPKVVELHSKFKKQGLQVLGLNVDSADKGAVANFSSELHMAYLTAQADDVIQAKFGVRSVPTVYIVDKKGRIAGVFHTINDETDRVIESMVKKLLVAE